MITDLDDARRLSHLRRTLGDAGIRLNPGDGPNVTISLTDLENLVGRLTPAPVEMAPVTGSARVVRREINGDSDALGWERRAECTPCGWQTGWYSENLWAYASDCADDHNADAHSGEKGRSTCDNCNMFIELVDGEWEHNGGWPLCQAPYPTLRAEPARKTARHS